MPSSAEHMQRCDLDVIAHGTVTRQVQVDSPLLPALLPTPTSPAQQIARLRSELDVVRGNTKVMSEMLTEMVPGQEDSSDLELLQVRGPPLGEGLDWERWQ